jgi:hypothetical protein
MSVIDYKPPLTVRDFIMDYRPRELFYDWIVGPVGSGKTTGLFFKLAYMAKLQEPGPDGIRRTRAVIVRNTLPQLRDTTITSWNYWFKDGEAGSWRASENKFLLKFDDVECDVLFRPLDTADDVARVLSLEITFAIIDEFVQIPRKIIDALSARVGRYPSKKDGGATNFGMWGSSNSDTEDNWWYDYLHHSLPSNARFFVQPSGLSEDAENVDNLPPNYYLSAIQGKPDEWVKQFIECVWGFSSSGKPVVSTFNPEMHLSKKPLLFNPHLPIVFGFDPGLGGTAAIFGQQDLNGRLLVMGEVIAEGYGTQRFIEELLKPYIRRRFPDARDIICAPDPASANRAQTDERAVVEIIRRYFPAKPESNNRLPLRLDAIDHFTTRLVEGRAALLIDEKECPTLVRALRGGWRFEVNTKNDAMKGPVPEKNQFSHPGDAFGYLARYFHKQGEREARYATAGRKPFTPPRFTNNGYHFR